MAVSIEGDWGSGKSSFMLQLQSDLEKRGGKTVWFNAWRHEKEDELWAAFALSFTEQLAATIPWYKRPFVHLKLAWMRFNFRRGWFELARFIALSALLVFVTWIMIAAARDKSSPLYQTWNATSTSNSATPASAPNKTEIANSLTPSPNAPPAAKEPTKEPDLKDLLPYMLKVGGPAAFLLLVFALWRKIAEVIGNPLRNDLSRYMRDPKFEDRSAFIEQFHTEFSRLVKAYAPDSKLFVFVDDLDRCDVPKAADLMRALNLLISNSAPVFYILGIDREKIAAGIAAKYEKLLPYLTASNNGVVAGVPAVEFGFNYIEKFVQIPFSIPKVADRNVAELLKSWTPQPEKTKPADSAPASESVDAGLLVELSTDSESVEKVVAMVAPALEYNPRRLKQFLNLFRLRALLASQTGLFGAPRSSEFSPLTFEQLAKLVAITIRWPLLFSDLEAQPNLLERLQKYTWGISEKGITPSGESAKQKFWASKPNLLSLIAHPAPWPLHWPEDPAVADKYADYSLMNIDIERYLQVSPVIAGRDERTRQEHDTAKATAAAASSTPPRLDPRVPYPRPAKVFVDSEVAGEQIRSETSPRFETGKNRETMETPMANFPSSSSSQNPREGTSGKRIADERDLRRRKK